jgi:hypothetical protein
VSVAQRTLQKGVALELELDCQWLVCYLNMACIFPIIAAPECTEEMAVKLHLQR